MPTATRVTPAWSTLLDAFFETIRADSAAGRARMTRVRRLAEDLAGDPRDVTPADISAWLDRLNASPEATRKYRHAARAFFRWAVDQGQLEVNPVQARIVTVYLPGDQWADALVQYVKAQKGAGVAESTIATREQHARRFARETQLAPWNVTADDYTSWIAGLSVAPATRTKLRDSLRSFYRWAYLRGRIDEDPTAEPSKRATTPPVPAQWEAQIKPWRSWLRGAGHPEPTVRLRLTQIRAFARDHASLDPWAVTIDDIIDWLAGKRWASETRRAYRSALRSFYRWALDTARIDEDPTERLPTVRMSTPQPRPAHDDEYRSALRNADECDRLALRLAADLGMRCGEVAQVASRDVTQTDAGWTLLVHGKGAKKRVLPIPEGLATLIRARDGYSFPGNYNGHVSPTWLSARISRLLPEGVTMHALRHRFATKAYNVDRDVFTVQQLLGHSSPATTQRYVLVNDDVKRRLVDAIAS